ncbi:MAG: Hsp20/alpha crystallin family protein [Chloroflexi bacterium]|nr:Hsp20/alpha crystallin family protein [Chloroflexota bacterium]
MSVSRWEPFKDSMTLRQAMDRLFEDSVVRPTRMWGDGPAGRTLPLDVYTTKDAIVLRASVPGVNSNDVEITIEGGTVTIRGETKPPAEEGTYLLQEQRYGPFARAVELGMPVQADKAEASFRDGVLTLTIPKAEEIKPKVIKVKST